MTRPWRRITLHLSQIFLTLGLTFTADSLRICFWLLVPVDDATAGQVVGRQLHHDTVFRKDADVVLPHLAADVRQDLVTIGELDAEHGVRQRLEQAPLDLYGAFLLRHVLRLCSCDATLDGVVHCQPSRAEVRVYASICHAQNR